MHEFIDIYCERTGPEFWAEPLNAISNLAFFVALGAALWLARRERVYDSGIVTLLVLLGAIGIGSTLFHTLATFWAMLADVIPILLFQLVYIPLYGRRVIKLSRGRNALLLAGFVALSVLFGALPAHWLNGSLSYAPALIYLGGLGLYHWRAHNPARYGLLIAAGLFALSLTFRSLDMELCDALPIGLHYFWHIFNGAVLYLALAVLIRYTAQARKL